jgi:hypothetical protein
MKREPIEANTLRSVGYAPCASVLEVELAGGEVYQFVGVPSSVHDGFLAADSKDRFFDERIQGAYPSRSIGPATAG